MVVGISQRWFIAGDDVGDGDDDGDGMMPVMMVMVVVIGA